MPENEPLRNLTRKAKYRLLMPDVSIELAKKNLPWLMRIDMPFNSHIDRVVELDGPLPTNPLIPPSKGIAYLVLEAASEKHEEACHCVFVTSVFPGIEMPWPSVRYEYGDLSCWTVGCTTNKGMPLVHVAMQVRCDIGKEMEAADALEEELKDSYILIKPKEYVQHLQLLAMHAAHVKQNGSTDEHSERPSNTE